MTSEGQLLRRGRAVARASGGTGGDYAAGLHARAPFPLYLPWMCSRQALSCLSAHAPSLDLLRQALSCLNAHVPSLCTFAGSAPGILDDLNHSIQGDGIGKGILDDVNPLDPGGWDREEYPGLRGGDGIGKSVLNCAVGRDRSLPCPNATGASSCKACAMSRWARTGHGQGAVSVWRCSWQTSARRRERPGHDCSLASPDFPCMGSGRVSRIARWGWDREEYPGFIPYRVIPCRVIPCRRALSLSDSFHPQIPSILRFLPSFHSCHKLT